MAYTHLLLRYGELFLKGGNQGLFERRLIQNLRELAGVQKITTLRGRLIVPYIEGHSILKRTFGLRSYSPAILAEKSMPEIQKAMLRLINSYALNDFVIRTQRSDKSFPLTSLEINKLAGQYIEEKSPYLFNLKSNNIFHIEINQEGVFMFREVISCFGGLPVGVEGKVALLLEDKASILAGILMMKRGCAVYPVVLREGVGEKALSVLQAFSPHKLRLHQVTDIALLQRFMQEKNLTALVTGERFETLKYGGAFGNLAVFRPLVGYGEEDVARELEKFKVWEN